MTDRQIALPDLRVTRHCAVSAFGRNTSAIGLAGSTAGLPGTWTDCGVVCTSTSSSDDGRCIGPGGQPITKDVDGNLIVHHCCDGNDHGTPELGINLLNWSSG
ncbi:hypothetical protein [Streptomyces sp. XM83C]|uniref:hypothetical protein n=1 Tax=Streptomyces sp. XM83C TaxID=2929781 RepID=UPI00338ADC9F